MEILKQISLRPSLGVDLQTFCLQKAGDVGRNNSATAI